MDAAAAGAAADGLCGTLLTMVASNRLVVGEGREAAEGEQAAEAGSGVGGAAVAASSVDAVGVRRRVTGKRRPPDVPLAPRKRVNAACAAEHRYMGVQSSNQPRADRGCVGLLADPLPGSAASLVDDHAESATCGVREGSRRGVDMGFERLQVTEAGGSVRRIGVGGGPVDAAGQGELNTEKYTSSMSRSPPPLPTEPEGAYQGAGRSLAVTASRCQKSGR